MDRQGWRASITDDEYRRGGAAKHGEAFVMLICNLCRGAVSMVSNAAVAEEGARLSTQLKPRRRDWCPKPDCTNFQKPYSLQPDLYQKFGTSAIGSPRYRCRACRSTFSLPKAANHRLRRPEKTEEIFRLLINKAAMRRLCAIADIKPQMLYQRIGVIYDACISVAARHEARVGDLTFKRLHLGVDRQDHMLSWASSLMPNETRLRAISTAEAKSGYVIAQHLNFDPEADLVAAELDSRDAGEIELPRAFRRHARLYLPGDPSPPAGEEAHAEGLGPTVHGAVVHESYTLMAHVQLLRPWIDRAEYVQFTMDRENQLDRAVLLSFPERVLAGSLDAFHLTLMKKLSVQQKKQAVARAKKELEELRAQYPNVKDAQLIFQLLQQRYQAARTIEDRRQQWVRHPLPTMSEPDKAVLCLTDDGRRSKEQIIWGFARASLRSIDRYLMQVRRKISVLERPISTSSAARRMWYGYSAYSPKVVMQLLEIFRVVYNYHLAGEDGKTPAQRLGMADARWSLADIIQQRHQI